jgi:hypothetical protein
MVGHIATELSARRYVGLICRKLINKSIVLSAPSDLKNGFRILGADKAALDHRVSGTLKIE